jgi:GT2 family glycosyltransferase
MNAHDTAQQEKVIQAKKAARALFKDQLNDFLGSDRFLVLPQAEDPVISVIVVTFNGAEMTLACLKCLVADGGIPLEVIIVDNGSIDQTVELLCRIAGATIVRNGNNAGFVRAVNQGASIARGKYLLLVNNDVCVKDGSMAAALQTIENLQNVGAVGAKLILYGDVLQEAGSIVWRDGTCSGYGRWGSPDAGEYNFLRSVDYCSAAFLLIRKDTFESLGRFDEDFSPAYYEETDFCVRLRNKGWDVVYNPRAEAYHFEFGSSDQKTGMDLQRRNQALFFSKHRDYLATLHRRHSEESLLARSKDSKKLRVLFIDDRVPFPSFGGGSPRAATIIQEIHALGCFVTMYPLQFPSDRWSHVREALPHEVEVMLEQGTDKLDHFLRERTGYYDVCFVSRPHNMHRFWGALARNRNVLDSARLVYDAQTVFATNTLLKKQMSGESIDSELATKVMDAELALAGQANFITTVSEREALHFRSHGLTNVLMLGHRLIPQPASTQFHERKGFLFVGNMQHNDGPNVDSILWFAEEVYPMITRKMGNCTRFLAAGKNDCSALAELRVPGISFLGLQPDLTYLYARSRVFVAPTRFASGMPYKIHEAASRGIPIVATRLLAEQLQWEHERELLIAETPEDFATQCVRLHEDEGLWNAVRSRALERVGIDCSPSRFRNQLQTILGLRSEDS